MKIAAIQMDIAWEEPAVNRRRAAELVARARARGAELAILPEMFSTGFSMGVASRAEPPDGPTVAFGAALAREHGLYLLCTRAARRDGSRPVNEALLFRPDGDLALRYAKIHPFSFAGEHEHFAPGNALAVADAGDLRVGLTICYDLRFPELYRALAFRGATLLVVVASWPAVRQEAWSALLVARAVECQAYVVGVNRVGRGGGLEYGGGSAIVDPLGRVVARGGDGEAVLVAGADPAEVARVRDELPFLPDARRDLWPCLWDEEET